MEKSPLICYAISMKIYDDVRLKALFQLLKTEADAYGLVIKRELATALKENPSQVHTVLEQEFQGQPPFKHHRGREPYSRGAWRIALTL